MRHTYCRACGKEITEETMTCPYCGAALGFVLGDPGKPTPDNMKAGEVLARAQIFYALDNGSFGWIALGLLIPVGLILYFLWRNKKPQRARALMIGTLFATVLIVGMLLITWIFPGTMLEYPYAKCDISKSFGALSSCSV